MKLRYKIPGALLLLIVIALVPLAVVLSHNSPCTPASELPANTESMKAIVYRCYGSPDILKLEQVAKPTPADNDVLVKVRAASVNPLDWHYMRGSPYIMRLGSGIGAPNDSRLGVDFAGTVEAVGEKVTKFKVGDEVFGGAAGAFGEYVVVPEDRALAAKPANVTFEQAAAVPIAAITALQALRDTGQLQSGQKVLINGASGGVGTYAVQIAKSFGAEVTGVCSTRNVDLVRSIGANHVIDYTKENYTGSAKKYDLIIDNVGNHSPLANRGVLSSSGKLVIVGGPKGNWLGPLMNVLSATLTSPFVDQELGMMLAHLEPSDLAALAELMETGQMTSVIDRVYSLNEIPDAIAYSESGRARGKIVIAIE